VVVLNYVSNRHLQDALASRARRADYLRAQIENLYGPSRSSSESSWRCAVAHADVNKAYNDYFAKYPPHPDKGDGEMKKVLDVANDFGS